MAILINEKKMVDENVFQYENKLKSPTSRFLDTTPTFVTYYHVDSDESTTDAGYQDTASIIGARSSLRYKKIETFPIYGVNQVVLQIEDTDQGLDTNFTDDAYVLPNTIKPLQNDFFMIPYLHDVYLFRITDIEYDNVMPDNFYKFQYKLEYIEEEKVANINNQVNGKFTCVLENIGTENKCIIESDTVEKIEKINDMYDDIASTYLALFYNDRHNCLLGEIGPNKLLYDPLQTQFINAHSLFNKKKNLQSVILTDQVNDPKRRIKYEKSIYRCIEKKDFEHINNYEYVTYLGKTKPESSFNKWSDSSIYILDIPSVMTDNVQNILSNEFVTSVRVNGYQDTAYGSLIQKYIRGNDLKLTDISEELSDEILKLDANIEIFFLTPIIMYIIQTIVNNEIKQAKK